MAVVDFGSFGLNLNLAFGERGGAVGGLLSGIEEDHVDLTVDFKNHAVAEGVDVDGIPPAVRGFIRRREDRSVGRCSQGACRLRNEALGIYRHCRGDVGRGPGQGLEGSGIAFHDVAFKAAFPGV